MEIARFHRARGDWERDFSSEDHRICVPVDACVLDGRSGGSGGPERVSARVPGGDGSLGAHVAGCVREGRGLCWEGGAKPHGALRLCCEEPGSGHGSYTGSEQRQDGVEFEL